MSDGPSEPGWRARIAEGGRYLGFALLVILIAAAGASIITTIDPRMNVRGVGSIPIETDPAR